MAYDALDLPCAGGSLHVGRWSGGTRTVLAAHGVTGNHRSWDVVAEGLDATLLAADLRGRGRSHPTGPAGMDAHAADLVGVLDQLDVDRAVLVGHSMGGFVVSRFARLHPDRVAGVVLVDGGLPFPAPPPGLSLDEVLAATIGPAAERLGMTFASESDYLDYWRPHPAIGPWWSPAVKQYLAYDLTGVAPDLRSSVELTAVRQDSADMLDPDVAAADGAALPDGTLFLRAQRGMLDQPEGLYPRDLTDRHAATFGQVRIQQVADVNHYTIVLGDNGATAVRDAVRASGTPGA